MAESSIVIDGRMIYQDQCHGIARVTIEMLKRFPLAAGPPVKMVVPNRKEARFSLDELPSEVELVHCDSRITAVHDVRRLNTILRRVNAAVFFSPYHSLAPMWVQCPLVVDVHDCILESDIRLTNGRLRRLAYMANTTRVLRSAASVVVPSSATAAELGAHYGAVPPTTVCRNGVDAMSFQRCTPDEVERARQTLALPERFVLHVGSRRAHKNQTVLLRALARMDPSVSLVLVGHKDPRVADPIDDLIRELNLTDRVRCLNSLPDDLLRCVYLAADAFAFPSTAEGFGLPPLEAMAAGVPVVASAVAAVAEVCGQAALYVAPYDVNAWADALTTLLTKPDVASNLVKLGLLNAAQTTWDEGASTLHGLLSSFVHDRPSKLPQRQDLSPPSNHQAYAA